MSNITARPESIANLLWANRVYVVPTFQRPYAWEKQQWKDLEEDVRNGAKKRYHYFSPIHVIKIASPNDQLWKYYVDSEIDDIIKISALQFRDADSAFEVFLVIDGQQRLTTLYSLLFACSPGARQHFINLPNSHRIPKVILGSNDDHQYFRGCLGLHPTKPAPVSRSQKRLDDLFGFIQSPTGCLFPSGTTEYLFLTGLDCEILVVELQPGARLAPFMTLNDRGKDLTILEKTKSLLMELDDNQPAPGGPNPVPINTTFGEVYKSINRINAYISDDDFVCHLGMFLWENTSNQVHRESSSAIYDNGIKNLRSPAGITIHSDMLPALCKITDGHDYLVRKIDEALPIPPRPVGTPSITDTLGLTVGRDVIEDYYALLLSLGIQRKQLGLLFAIRDKYSIELHDKLGVYPYDNGVIINMLLQELSNARRDINNETRANLDDNARNIMNKIADDVESEIHSIKSYYTRDVTPLQLAEMLKLFVGDAKPGTFSSTWNTTFSTASTLTQQDCLNHWMDYILKYYSRDTFIIDIARTTKAHNSNSWVGHLLREYEVCCGGSSAHKNPNFDIEHFFGIYTAIASMAQQGGFPSQSDYERNFRERIGNKMVLDHSLNICLAPASPIGKIAQYISQSCGRNSVMRTNPSLSSIKFGNDLSRVSDLNSCRIYVLLRSIRLAAFAAKRF